MNNIYKASCLLAAAAIMGTAACKGKQAGVIARVGHETITQEEYDRKLQDISSQYRGYLSSENGRKQFLDILIREKLILAAAEKSGVAKSSEYTTQIKTMRNELDLKMREFSEYLLAKMWLEKMRNDGTLNATEDDVKTYYKQYPFLISISHILVPNEKTAESLLREIKSGRNFEAYARKYSLDPETSAAGGKIPPFLAGEFLPELESAAINMKTGEVQGVFKTKFGYHILKKNALEKVSLAQVQDRIVQVLEKKKLDDYLAAVEKKTKVEVLDEKYSYK